MIKINKAVLRIPTQEQYAYIELEVEGSPNNIVEAYKEFTAMVKPKIGLPVKEFNQALDTYLQINTIGESEYMNMSLAQQYVIQEIKKSVKRLSASEVRNDAKRMASEDKTYGDDGSEDNQLELAKEEEKI